MKMEELLSAASDEMEQNKNDNGTSNTSAEPEHDSPLLNKANKSPLVSPRNSTRTRNRKDSGASFSIDTDNDSSPSSSTQTSTPTGSPNLSARSVASQCKTPACVVCTKGPPPSFSKGTPIWAQILHLVLYALTESAKVNTLGSPKMKVKRYFHLRDDIYEYIAIHWDVICRRERIKNWRHTIGMTLSHYQNLFQNGYHIYQNTGYWSMKDNVPSPYVIDPLIGEPAKTGKRKYVATTNGSKSGMSDKDKDTNMTPFISEFPINTLNLDGTNGNTTTITATTSSSGRINMSSLPLNPSPNMHTSIGSESPSVPVARTTAGRFEVMKGEIDKFKREMCTLQSEIDNLQEQLQVKKAEEQLLKYLQEGISNFRDKIKQRIELLKVEMVSNHSEHQQQIQTMSSELTQLREIGSDMRNAFQYQFSRLVNLNNPSAPANSLALQTANLSSSC